MGILQDNNHFCLSASLFQTKTIGELYEYLIIWLSNLLLIILKIYLHFYLSASLFQTKAIGELYEYLIIWFSNLLLIIIKIYLCLCFRLFCWLIDQAIPCSLSISAQRCPACASRVHFLLSQTPDTKILENQVHLWVIFLKENESFSRLCLSMDVSNICGFWSLGTVW